MEQGRMVSYLYRYKENTKYENSGFVKMQQFGDGRCRFHIGIKDYIKKDRPECHVYLFKKTPDDKFTTYELDNMQVNAGMGELKRIYTYKKELGGTSYLDAFDGMIITYSPNEQICSTWKEYSLVPYTILEYVNNAAEETVSGDNSIVEKLYDYNSGTTESVYGDNSRTIEAVHSDNMGISASAHGDNSHTAGAVNILTDRELANNETSTSKIPIIKFNIDDTNKKEIEQNEASASYVAENMVADNINSIKEIEDFNVNISETYNNASEKQANDLTDNEEYIKETDATDLNHTYPNICEKMLATFPGLPQFGNNQIIDSIKIEPKDIGMLDMANWRLGVNSFLSHGYYNYKYIMLAKIEFEEKQYRYVIGVPGVYTNKQKYLANMFGFDVFIPVNRTNMLTGTFGYWVMEIINV